MTAEGDFELSTAKTGPSGNLFYSQDLKFDIRNNSFNLQEHLFISNTVVVMAQNTQKQPLELIV